MELKMYGAEYLIETRSVDTYKKAIRIVCSTANSNHAIRRWELCSGPDCWVWQRAKPEEDPELITGNKEVFK